MPKPIVPIAFSLALITGAWFGQAYSLFAPIEPHQTDDTAAKAEVNTVLRLYDAINILLRTADDTALLAVIAPDFVDHVDAPGTPSDRDGLVRYLAGLRETHPTLRLTPEDIVAQSDRVVARLAPTTAATGAILGIPLAGKEPWPRVDVVRIHEGRIVERWSDPTGYAPATTLFAETITFSLIGDLIPMLQRVTLAPGASLASSTWLGPAIISIESGDIEVTTTRTDLSPAVPGRAGDRPETLAAGAAFTIADGFAYSFANRTASTTAFLVFSLKLPPGPYVPGWATGAGTGSENDSIEDLAGTTLVTAHHGRLSVGLARIALAPGARLGLHPVTGPEIVAVEAGTATAAIAGYQTSAWLRDTEGRSVTAIGSAQVAAGFSLTVARGATTSYANETAQPTTLLLLTIAPGYGAGENDVL